ncbi:solute carrier family 46 member 3 isoform X2 [Contarinia nasturtii]|uniref:solute carrier family 46 member 3 isoform X2 n=1 Tax=Contarinia nasturtii TaxID=265458 RepID=UPI0012D3F8AC|nr:solute carrier family 46 member 3 isoform X2 [Contarinia nasturtii]
MCQLFAGRMVEEKAPSKKNETLFKEMSFSKKVRYIYDHITLEPLVACFVLPSMLLMLGVQNLNLEKACRVNLNYNQTVCDALRNRDTSHYADEEVAIQKLVARMTGWKVALNSAIPCFLILFFGSWSDRHGKRKPCILIPLCGQIMMAFSLLLCIYFERTPIEVAIFVEVFFPCITGSHFTMMVGIFSYMADITKERDRTVRIGIISLVYSVGMPFGMAFSGILIKRVGFYGVFALAGTLYTTALFYGIFVLKEVPPKEKDQQIIKKSFLADFFDFAHIKDTFLVAFKTRAKNRRMKILVLMAVVIIVVGPLHGEMSLFYLFTRYKWNWSEVEFSFFSTYSVGVHLLGTGFAMSILSSMFKVDDALIGSMASFSKILSSFVYAFSQVEWHMFIGPVAEIIGGAALIAMRSLASKIVSSNELGKVNSLFGIVESIAPLIYSPVLAAIYSATLTTMPGAFFLVGGCMSFPGILLFLWIYTINRAEAREKAQNDATANVQKVDEKPTEVYLQNEGLSVITEMKNL